MTFKLPNETKFWTQPNNSDRFGSLAFTRQIDLDEAGYLKLAKRSRSLFDSNQDADLGEIISITYDSDNDRYLILTDDKIFYTDTTLTTFTEDANANVPTTLNTRSDMQAFNDNIYVSAGTTDDLRRWTGSAWSTSLYSLSSNDAPMAVFENRVELAIGQGNDVLLINTSHVLQQTLTLPSNYRVTSMAWSNNRLYIGTRHSYDQEALMFEWDGTTSSANNGYPCGSVRIDSVKAYKGTVVAFTGEGQLLAFNGGGFTELASLPVYYRQFLFSKKGNSLTGATSHRGMVVKGDRIYINLFTSLAVSADDDTQAKFLNDVPGGVWCYDPRVGLYHKHAMSTSLRVQTGAVATTDVNTTTDVITTTGVPDTGTPVIYDDGSNGDGTALAPLKHRKKYYVIKTASTTMKLASTYADALAGTAINLTGTGNNAQYFVYLPNRDFGNDQAVQTSAIAVLNSSDPQRSDAMGLLFGGAVRKPNSTAPMFTVNALAEKQENRGVAITSRLDASALTDNFIDVTVKFRKLTTAEDKILVKYRTVDTENGLQALDANQTQTATITDSNTFTTTADLSTAAVGDEVTFHAGTAAGYTAHITAISYSAPTYTVDIDETLQNVTATETALFTIDRWEKLGTITSDDCERYTNGSGTTSQAIGGAKTFRINRQATWMQLKFELRGEDVAIEDVLVNNKTLKSLIV